MLTWFQAPQQLPLAPLPPATRTAGQKTPRGLDCVFELSAQRKITFTEGYDDPDPKPVATSRASAASE
jgi:hypothetical protein